ncbi:tetratricopeptide repeat protein [Candidatus Zixiibacteriota bacterium]
MIKLRLQVGLTLFSLGMLVVCSTGCGGDPSAPRQPTLADAWQKFAAGDYESAITTFYAVLADDSTLTEGYTGLGWSFAFDGRLDSATTHLHTSIDHDSTAVDALALLSAVFLAQGDGETAIEHALVTLAQDSAWSFAHYSGIDYQDLHLILAAAYYGQGESSFVLAQAQVDILNPTNGLNPDNPDTWDGHPSYSAALLMMIQMIEEDIGAEIML